MFKNRKSMDVNKVKGSGFVVRLVLFSTLLGLATITNGFSQTVKVGTVQLVPWGYETDSGKTTGILFEATNAIFREAGIDFENNLLPLKRAILSLELGEIDVLTFARTDKSQSIAHPVGLVSAMDNVVIGLHGLELPNEPALANLSVAEPLGFMHGNPPVFYQKMQRTPVSNYSNAIRMLSKKRVDTVSGLLPALRHAARLEGLTVEDLGTPFVLNRNEIWLQMSRRSDLGELREVLTRATDKLRERGVFEKLFRNGPDAAE